MKVEFVGMTMTGRAVDALIAATGYRIRSEYRRGKLHYFHLATAKWMTVGGFGRALVQEINEWMGENGLVKWDILRNAHYSDGTDIKFFKVVE